ncbi:hypothetical protein [Streptomyces scopuliridis]|uniref:hypothetical protein n=1 Tax=Streptomyces scopuliridis TaxID=452529 RepID=UPI0036C08895
MGAPEAGAVARGQCEVVELDGMAPASRGAVIADRWDEGMTATREALTGIANRDREQRGSRSTEATEPALHATDVTQREQADLMRLEAFIQETILPHTHPYTMERRRVLEALGKASGLCTTRTMELTTGDIILCTHKASHYHPEGYDPSWKGGMPGGWHLANASIWDDSASYSHPHTTATA